MKCKIFRHHDSNVLETQINEWLSSGNWKYFKLNQVIMGGTEKDIHITIFYQAKEDEPITVIPKK